MEPPQTYDDSHFINNALLSAGGFTGYKAQYLDYLRPIYNWPTFGDFANRGGCIFPCDQRHGGAGT